MDYSKFEAEWHPTKNLPLVFRSPLSMGGKYWWLGACGHEWEATLNKRTGKGNGCLVCSSLALVCPDVASEWHPTKNGELTPVQISAQASGKYWWQCEKDHEWEDYLHERTKGRGCLICSGRTLLAGFNDLITLLPNVAAEWHPTKNGNLSPEQFLVNSSAKVWWLCSENHEWEDSVQSCAVKSLGCPYCANRKLLVGFNDFATVNPSVAATEWHPTKNGNLSPDQFITGSATKVWWLCSENHEWEVSFNGRSKGSDCPYCANRRVLAGFNDLATVNHPLAAEWHPTKNGELTPQDVTARSSSTIWWVCPENHEWEAKVGNRDRGSTCPVCEHPETYDKELIVGTNDLGSVEPQIASQWHPTKNGNLTPDSVVRMFDEKAWWRSADCGYEWEATPKSRKTADCPECIRHRIRRGVNDLASVNPVIHAQWHPTKNEPLTPQYISGGSEKKVWWLCGSGHEWEALVKNRVANNSGCPVCSGTRQFINGRTFRGRKVVIGSNDLATMNPEVAAEWHPTLNGDLTPHQVSIVSHKKVWWLGACGHEWEYEVRHRVQKRKGCTVCK